MEFSPNNHVVKLCLQGMAFEEQDNTEEASRLFLRAWNEAANAFEEFLAAFYIARNQKEVSWKLKWTKTALQLALQINNEAVASAIPFLYSKIASFYVELNEPDNAKANNDLANSFSNKPSDEGPFYHGTKADLQLGELLKAGVNSNYKNGLKMNHVYFTALVNGAGLAATLAKGEGPERVYVVEPTGDFENDPNVTNKKFPGNPTRSYRSDAPLKIIGEIKEWAKQTTEDLHKWKQKLANNKGEIIN